MRRTQSSDCRPTLPGARIRALPAAARPPAPLRGRCPAQALGPCRQGPRLNAVVVARRFAAHASRSVVRSRTRLPKRCNAGPAPLTEDARLDRHRRHERALRASATMPSSAHAAGFHDAETESLRVALGPRPPRPPPMARRRCPLATRAEPCEGRGRCDAPRAWLRRRGLGGGSRRAWRLSLPGRRCGCGLARNG